MARRGEVIPLEPTRETGPGFDAASQAPPEPNIRDHLEILLKRKWVVIAVFALVVGAAALWTIRLPRIYRASATLEINPNAPRYLGSGVQEIADSGTTYYWQTKEFFETQYQILRSRAVAQRVVDKLGLDRDLAFLGLEKVSDPEQREELLARADPAAMLQRMIRVDPVKDSRIVQLSIEDTDRQRATRLVNALSEAFIEQNLDRRLDTTRAASLWLADQLDDLKIKLENSELRLHHFKRENDILTASFEDRQSIASQRILTLNDALTKARTRRAELEARMSTIADVRRRVEAGDVEALETIQTVAQSSMIANLKLRLLQLEEERAEVEGRYLEKHPKRVGVQERLEEARTSTRREMEKIVRAVEIEHREAVDYERSLVGLIESAKREAFEINKREIDYVKFKRETENNQRLYDLVLQRLKEADLSALLRANNVRVLDAALQPNRPVKPNVRVILMLALVLGALAGVACALLLEQLDNTVKTQDDVEKFLALPFLGIVPTIRDLGQEKLTDAERGSRRDLFAHHKPKSSVAECVRSVRTNLLFMTPDKPLRRLLVTSSGPQEGKTTVATNLAIAMAQNGSRTLLVDTDMRRPRIHRAFGMNNDVGLSSLILGTARNEEALRSCGVPNLTVLACGPIPPNPAELMHTARFQQLFDELGQRFDRIIFDSPPVGAVADAMVLSGATDGVVLVVKAGRTAREVALRTRQQLQDVNARIFGVVLNDLDLEKRGYGYYYYHQKYGYYYGERGQES